MTADELLIEADDEVFETIQWLRRYVDNYLVHVPVSDGQRVINGFAAVQIPDWSVKQRIDALEAYRLKIHRFRGELTERGH
jgi:hypothetical protein